VPSDLGNGSWFGMAENGVLTTTVADQALVFSVLAARPELAAVAAPGRLRIGLSTTVPALGVPLDRHYRAAVQETGDLLADAGHDVSTADPAYGSALALPEIAHWTAGTEMDARQVADRSRLEPRIRRHAAVGRMVMRLGGPWPGPRERWRTRAEAYFAGHDILVTPALAQSPKAAKQWGERGWLANIVADVRYAPFAAPWNLIGWPAMAVPAGLHPNGMPLSVQLVGPPGSEARLLAVAAQLESARPWPRVAPGY
jgi:amidase